MYKDRTIKEPEYIELSTNSHKKLTKAITAISQNYTERNVPGNFKKLNYEVKITTKGKVAIHIVGKDNYPEVTDHKEILKRLKRKINTLRNIRDLYRAIYEKTVKPQEYCNRIRKALFEAFLIDAQQHLYAIDNYDINKKQNTIKLYRQRPQWRADRIEHIQILCTDDLLMDNKIQVTYTDTLKVKGNVKIMRQTTKYLALSGTVNKTTLAARIYEIYNKILYKNNTENPYDYDKSNISK